MKSPLDMFRGKALSATPAALDALRKMGGSFFAYPRSAYVDGAFYAGQAASYAHMYATQPNVRIVVDAIARVSADRSLKLYRIDGTGPEAKKVEDGSHPAAATMREPNDWQATKEFLGAIQRDRLIYDNAYVIDFGPALEGKRFLVRVPPHAMLVANSGRIGAPRYRLMFQDGQWLDLSPEEVIHFRGYAPTLTQSGVSPMETLRTMLVEEATRQARMTDMVRGGFVKGGIIERPLDAPEWSQQAMERFSESFAARLKGVVAGATPVLEEGMKFQEAGITPKEAEVLASRKFALETVALVYGINPAYFSTEGDLAAARAQMEEDVVTPLLGLTAEVLTDQFVRRRYNEQRHFFRFRPRRETDITKLFDAATKGTGGAVMTQNEFRGEFLDLPPVEGGDELTKHPGAMSGAIPPAPGEEDRGAPDDNDNASAEKALRSDLRRLEDHEIARVKAVQRVSEQVDRREAYAADIAEVLRKHFRRQLDSLEGKAVLNSDRWNEELTADLFALATRITDTEGELTSQRLAGVWSKSRTRPYLERGAEIQARNINGKTADLVRSRRDAGDDDDPARTVLNDSMDGRATSFGKGLAVQLTAFAGAEAARQNPGTGNRMKVWIASGAANSRHDDMDGETVPVGENFSNGMAWPGDPAGGPEETAGCQCSLDVI